MLTTILLISTICYSNECHEFVMDSFSEQTVEESVEGIALGDCLLQGIELEMENPGLAWHCSEPSDFIPIYTPRSIPE